MNKFDGISVFVQVNDSGSYSAAGRVLGVSASAIGKAIVRLEERLGVRLFHRNNRSIGLTPEGAVFLAHCQNILAELAVAESDLSTAQEQPSGKLRVSAPVASEGWTCVFLQFMAKFPQIELEVSYTNRLVDLVEEGFDVVLRIGPLQDSRLLTRRLGTFSLRLVASPGYLEQRGTPETIGDLLSHDCLRNRNVSSHRIDNWPLGPEHAHVNAGLANRLVADHYAVLLSATLNGFGIGCLPSFWADEHIASGALRHLLADQTANQRAVSAVWPGARGFPVRLAAFVDFMARNLPPILR
ncbi:LysR family transcriptional regulator [Ancylobacter amanitiformis]|uniref:DNA-binding transcriptional LysR family regulator n=1 Tax=Ancylobacter amanitiformis TaxID=217069 RepID=A0ABU0LS31_9HYPH|nr:LysR family transcriptional regulator [Ancylobacter amanitiformis]MDQ0511522.1 DNA-binding transcriptional LysR family regulator [Ancylobacter amanitiformis]